MRVDALSSALVARCYRGGSALSGFCSRVSDSHMLVVLLDVALLALVIFGIVRLVRCLRACCCGPDDAAMTGGARNGFLPLIDETSATDGSPQGIIPGLAAQSGAAAASGSTLRKGSPIKNLALDRLEEASIRTRAAASTRRVDELSFRWETGPKSAVYKPVDCAIL